MEIVVLGEIRQTQKDKNCMFSCFLLHVRIKGKSVEGEKWGGKGGTRGSELIELHYTHMWKHPNGASTPHNQH